MQRLLEGATTGKLHKIRARVQGPFGGHTLPVAEMEAPQHMIVFVGGVGAPTVLSILKRLAIHRDANKQHLGKHMFNYQISQIIVLGSVTAVLHVSLSCITLDVAYSLTIP